MGKFNEMHCVQIFSGIQGEQKINGELNRKLQKFTDKIEKRNGKVFGIMSKQVGGRN